VGNWTFGSKLYLYSGRPFSVTNSQIPGNLSTSFGGPVLADLLDPGIANKSCSRSAVHTSCFTSAHFATRNQQADFGNVRPNSFRGPGFFTVASQLTKKIPVRERTALELGASAYNLFNHPNFAVPTGNVSSGSVGLITSTVSSPTSIYGSGQGAIVSGRVLVLLGKLTF
jgi:hypothetical protein